MTSRIRRISASSKNMPKRRRRYTTKESVFRVQQMVKRVPRRSVMTRQNAMEVQDELEKGLEEIDSEGDSSEKGSTEISDSASSEDASSVGGSSTEMCCSSSEGHSPDVKACVASDLSFCRRCDEGPDCCADASHHDSGSSVASSADEESDATEVPSVLEVENGRVSDDGLDNDDSWNLEDDGTDGMGRQTKPNEQRLQEERLELCKQLVRSEKDTEGNYSEGDSDKAVAEYEYFVDEDDDDYGEELEYDGDGRNVVEFDDDDEEYCVDDDYEEEAEEADIQTHNSRRVRYSRYQEPLEVILEILGEEGEDETENKKSKQSGKIKEQKNSSEDLMSFSSSGEFSPDSIEEYCARKNQVNLLNLIRGNNTIDSTIESLPSGQTSLTNDDVDVLLDKEEITAASSMQAVCEGQMTSLQQPHERHTQASPGNLMDVPIPQLRLNPLTPHCQKTEELSDRDKLKSLTSEIEAYLKETTQLLESASASTRNYKAKNEADIQQVKRVENTPSNNNSPAGTSFKLENKQVNLIDLDSFSFDKSTTKGAVSKSADANVSDVSKPPKEFHLHLLREEEIINLSTTVTDISTPVNLTNISPLGLTADSCYPEQPIITPPPMFVGHFNICEQDQASPEKDGACHDAFTPPKGFTDNTEIFRTINDTPKFAETEYFSAHENSLEVMDALEWEEKKSSKQETQRIIYKPSDCNQEDFIPFASLVNSRKGWASSLEEFNACLESSGIGEPMSLPILNSQRPLSPVKKSPSFEESILEDKPLFEAKSEEASPVRKVELKEDAPSEQVKLRRKTPMNEVTLRKRASVDEVKLRKMSTVDDVKLKKRSSVDEARLRKRSSLRCESPPPTVDCLESLEKLCNRLSLEQEMLKENESKFGAFCQLNTKKGDSYYSNCQDSGFESMVHQEIDSSKQFHSVGSLHGNSNSPTKMEIKKEISQPYITNGGGKENQLSVTVKENDGNSGFEAMTSEDEEFLYIDEKLDEIFRYVDEASKRNSLCSVEDFDVTKEITEETKTSISSVPKSKKNKMNSELQSKLSELFNDLDSMYEKHVIKMKDLYAEQAWSSQVFTPKGYLMPDKKHDLQSCQTEISQPQVSNVQSLSSNEPAKENDPYQDILDVSEDLKNLCVFHVNRPPWDDDGHATSSTAGETYPEYYDSDGATPEGEYTALSSGLACEKGVEVFEGSKMSTNSGAILIGREDKERPTKPVVCANRKEKIGDVDSRNDSGVHVAILLKTLKTENQRCYEVTLRCLQKIVASTVTIENISSILEVSPDAANDGPRIHTENMSALQLAAEGRDYLMWCPDQEFDNAVSALDIRGLVELVQTLQDAMAVEQQTFDSLTQQLELVQDPLQQQRLSAALCTSQTRLARLCSRNMRCFTQQALKARQRDGSESRSSSPRDSGLVVSSAGASDAEGDPRSPTGASFKHSLAFFQRAAHLMANNTRNCSLAGARQKEARRRSSRGSSCYGSSSSEAWSVASDDPAADHYAGKVMGGDLVYEDDLVNLEDQGTYEQVLFINGRPQYQDDISSTSTTTCGADRSRSGSWTRVRVDGSTGVGSAAGRASDSQLPSVSYSNSSLPRRGTANASTDTAAVAAEAQTQTLAADLNSYVTLPRRKPYLNFKSVACGSNSSSSSNHSNLSYINSASADFDNEDLRYFKERVGILKNNGVSTITRTQSFKEGLNSCSHEFGDQHNNPAYGLSRTQSFNDGLAGDFNDLESAKPKLQRVPSVDEILESVKTLRAKKTMVKSSPDLLSAQEPVYHSASLPRHKSSKGKAPRPSGTSALLGVRYNGTPSGDNVYERVPEPDYEQIPDAGGRFYENVCRGNNHYENIHLKGEVIYDSPRPTSEQHHHLHHHQHHPHHLYDKVHSDLHYENVKFDTPLYENIDEKEPTYMNVVGSKTNVYANLDAPANKKSSSSGSIKSSKSKSNKVTISGNSMMQGTTYDVPRAATHIYDSPQKQVRSVASSSSSSEYDTPKNNRSVLPQSTQIVLKAKSEQKQKIDDIFADCDKDSLEGDRDRAPDIPSPDYGSEEEGDGYEDASNDYVSSEFPDEGLGESDTRSYYTEDPAGLEVILEEPEDDYCSSHVSEDDLQREVDITYGLKGERRSLDGSEGIGSAEGDSHSSGGSEHYGEEDCASSGIHSEDTPSPGPPVDHEKEENQQDSNNKSQKRGEDDTRVQQDRCVEVYPETVRQRQRNMMTSANKVDIKNWTSSGNDTLTSPSKVKKFLPSVKALRNQFETGKTNNNRAETNGNGTTNGNLSRKSSISNSSVASSIEKTSSTNSLNSANGSVENLHSSNIENSRPVDPDEPVEPIYSQFKKVDEELRELMSKPPSTTGWNPRPLLKRLYYVPDAPKHHSQGTTYINIEGYLEKLPSGRKKATFWNAWKRRYFVAKDGVLYYYQNPQADKASMKMTLMGGKVECMEPSMVGVDDGSRDSKAGAMIGIDDGKGHYVVVRCSSKQEAERWRRALETHTVEDFASQYVQPWPIPTNPTMLRDTLIIDLGSCSVRAGVLASQATLPQVFFPSVVATERESRRQIWGFDALSPDVRSVSSVSFPVRPSHKISKYSVDLSAVSSLLQKAFADLKVDPKNYNIQLSVPRVLNPNTQAELLRLLFDKYGVKSVNLTHQSILALYAYNATSGIVVDIGDRLDIVPVIDGYIVDGGVSRVPYGGYRILDHLRQFLYMRNVSLINEVESYIIRQVLENICYCAHHYNTEKARCTNNPDNYEKGVSLAEYFQKDCPYEFISLDFGRFQATEGLFNPDAWGLDHPGIHKLVHKAIMECSMDIRKEMSRSIFLAGGVTQLPGLVERLTTEIDNLTPPAIRPKVHASPYRYHAAYIGACVLAESPAFTQSKITREDWNKHGNAALKKWSL
ncbi:uncharacterized protein [Macrobrachium rosenbergii]|uniref:uncharacterized protein isoform X4 n=1 Tax=Macrobrachium rosenbergii TaxID=79674 RepID=UPI0034D3E9F9